MTSSVSFVLDGAIVTLDFERAPDLRPTTTVLNYLRNLPRHKGVKEGCAQGDCGACTVVLAEPAGDHRLRYSAVDSCLVFLPMLHRKQLITVENLKGPDGTLHPVQQALVETHGSQCGFCTPGIVMSLFCLYKKYPHPTRPEITDALTGNLCRCTGYKPIVEAAERACIHGGIDRFTPDEPRVAALLRSIPPEPLHISADGGQYVQPVTIADAFAQLDRDPGAVIIAGGTDFALRVTKNHEHFRSILDLSAVGELKFAREEDGVLRLGAGLTMSEVMKEAQETHPALCEMLALFGSRQIRNMATLGGNLGSASPIGDTLPVLVAYDARIVLQSTAGQRQLPVLEFLSGYRTTARRTGELIHSVLLPKPPADTVVRSYKISKRRDLDISIVSGGFRLQRNPRNNVVESVRLVYGGMAEKVKCATITEQFLHGRRWDRETVEEAMPLIEQEFSPITDVRSGAVFRKAAARNLLMKFWSDVHV